MVGHPYNDLYEDRNSLREKFVSAENGFSRDWGRDSGFHI